MANVKYREVKRKAAVGERIRVFGHSDRSQNTTHTVARVDDDGHVYYEGGGRRPEGYVVLEPVTDASSPLGTSFLTSDPLYVAFRQFVVDNAPALRKLLTEIESADWDASDAPAPTPLFTVSDGKLTKLTRAAVIEKARADVAELLRIGADIGASLTDSARFEDTFFTAEFHANRDKRTVTALVSTTDRYGSIAFRNSAKFTAKCSPADVFHAEIGKAIALRKALGLTVPSEYTDAPQPEPATGAKVRKLTGGNTGATMTLDERDPALDGEEYGGRAFTTLEGGWIGDKQYEVIDDTDVDYSVETQASVA